LAPTVSTIAALVIGDTLTVTLVEARDFQPENFCPSSTGRQPQEKASNKIIKDKLPYMSEEQPVTELTHLMATGKQVMALVQNGSSFIGVVTDGGLRHTMEKHQGDIFNKIVSNLCSFPANDVTGVINITRHRIHDRTPSQLTNRNR